jgi:hypothetical protein
MEHRWNDDRTKVTWCCLHEMSDRAIRVLAKNAKPDVTWGKVSVSYAHNWVRSGQLHTTPLWINEGRIRRADG